MVKTDIQDYWRQSWGGDNAIPQDNTANGKSRLYGGEGEAAVVWSGTDVIYAKQRENIYGLFNGTRGSHVFLNSKTASWCYEPVVETEYASVPVIGAAKGDTITVSFDVSDFDGTGSVVFSISSEEIVVDKVGHYTAQYKVVYTHTGTALVVKAINGAVNRVVCKNLKGEKNIVDSQYSVAPSVVDNRVKIGKHWYRTTQIGNLIWTAENLNEDLGGMVIENFDWEDKCSRGYVLTNQGVGGTVSLSRTDSSDWKSIWFEVSEGEKVHIKQSGRSSVARTWCMLDSSNKIVDVAGLDYGEGDITIPSGVKTFVYNTQGSGKCIQSSHTFSGGTWEGYYNNDPTYGVKGYGKLYTWDAICKANETPRDALAAILPAGWRVPTNADFNALVATSGLTSAKIKEKWYQQNVGTNETGFSSVGAGYREISGKFTGGSGVYQSSTASSGQIYRFADSDLSRTLSQPTTARSVRLVRDATASNDAIFLNGQST